MATANKFNPFVEDLAEGKHDLGADTLKVALTNSAPAAANGVIADITQIANGNGYLTGGTTTTQSSSAQTSGTYKLIIGDVTFTASGGTMATFRYPVLYNDTPAGDPLILYWDYGSGVSLTVGNSFTVDFHATNGVLTIA